MNCCAIIHCLEVNVNPGLSFEQIIMGLILKYFIPIFVRIGHWFLESRFLAFLTIYGHVNHPGNSTSIMLMIPCTLKLTYKIWSKMITWFMRKASINFHMRIALGQGQEKILTFNTHNPSITQFDVCIYQLSDHRLQQVLKIPLFFSILLQKA